MLNVYCHKIQGAEGQGSPEQRTLIYTQIVKADKEISDAYLLEVTDGKIIDSEQKILQEQRNKKIIKLFTHDPHSPIVRTFHLVGIIPIRSDSGKITQISFDTATTHLNAYSDTLRNDQSYFIPLHGNPTFSRKHIVSKELLRRDKRTLLPPVSQEAWNLIEPLLKYWISKQAEKISIPTRELSAVSESGEHLAIAYPEHSQIFFLTLTTYLSKDPKPSQRPYKPSVQLDQEPQRQVEEKEKKEKAADSTPAAIVQRLIEVLGKKAYYLLPIDFTYPPDLGVIDVSLRSDTELFLHKTKEKICYTIGKDKLSDPQPVPYIPYIRSQGLNEKCYSTTLQSQALITSYHGGLLEGMIPVELSDAEFSLKPRFPTICCTDKSTKRGVGFRLPVDGGINMFLHRYTSLALSPSGETAVFCDLTTHRAYIYQLR